MSIISKSQSQQNQEFPLKENGKEFISPELVNQIKELNISNQQLIVEFGKIEFQLQHLKQEKQKLINALERNKAEEYDINKTLKNKYGDVNINIETGEITPL